MARGLRPAPENGAGAPLDTEGIDYRPRLVLDTVRHRAVLIVAATVAGLLIGLLVSLARPGLFTATASVLVNPLAGNPYSPGITGQDSLVGLETEAQVASSDAVSAMVARQLGGGVTPAALEDRVTVSVPSNTQIIEVSFSGTDAARVRAVAEAYADSFLAYRAERASGVITARTTALERQRDRVRDQLAAARKKVARGNGDQTYAAALEKSLSSQLVSIQGKLNTLGSGDSTPSAGHVISPATVPAHRSGIGAPLYLAAGGLLGLACGLAVALARQRRDDRIHHADELGEHALPLWTGPADPRGHDPAEAIRRLRLELLAVRAEPPVVVVVGPAGPRGGTGDVADRLADSLARLGKRVVLADLAPDEPCSSAGAGADSTTGLTDLLVDGRPDPRSLLTEIRPGLGLLPRGRAGLAEAAEFLDPGRMHRLVRDIGRGVDHVVFRSPALSDSAGRTLAGLADATVVVVTLGRSTRADLAAVDDLVDRGEVVLGWLRTAPRRTRPRLALRRSRAAVARLLPAAARATDREERDDQDVPA